MLFTPLISTAGLLAAWYGLPHAVKACQRRRLRELVAATPTLCLTYDDGPGPGITDRVLDRLAEHSARATFFPLARHARHHPGVLDRARAAGHEIGVHGDRHANAWLSPPWTNVREVTRGADAVAPWLGPEPLLRPPHGKATPATWLAARRRGLRMAWWTHDSDDTAPALPHVDDVVAAVRRSGGGVVLLHDRPRDQVRMDFVVTLTDALLQEAARSGWRVAPLGELTRSRRAADGVLPSTAGVDA